VTFQSLPYRPLLSGGHKQTLYAWVKPRRFPRLPAPVERLFQVAPDARVMAHCHWHDRPDRHPTFILLHGLEGSSGSHYARAMMAALEARGWRGVVPHFRGCGGELNRMPRAYHSGDHLEAQAMLAAIRARIPPAARVYVVGVSVGGSVILNWLGRAGRDAARMVTAAAAVSAPLDLTAAGISIGQGLNRIYTHNFLTTLKPKSLAMAERFPGLIDAAKVKRARSMDAFDDAVTAVLHGFVDSADYWRRASSKPWLSGIAVPTLVLNARNDPFVPEESLPIPTEASADVLLDQPGEGGHVGFLSGPFPGNVDWLPRRLLDFFVHQR